MGGFVSESLSEKASISFGALCLLRDKQLPSCFGAVLFTCLSRTHPESGHWRFLQERWQM